jgi:hypothetical protein
MGQIGLSWPRIGSIGRHIFFDKLSENKLFK